MKPVSDKHQKVKPVITEIFLSHYNLAFKFIHETDIDEGEFIYPKNEKEGRKIEIDFRDSIE